MWCVVCGGAGVGWWCGDVLGWWCTGCVVMCAGCCVLGAVCCVLEIEKLLRGNMCVGRVESK